LVLTARKREKKGKSQRKMKSRGKRKEKLIGEINARG
jgi:hypothetical protein